MPSKKNRLNSRFPSDSFCCKTSSLSFPSLDKLVLRQSNKDSLHLLHKMKHLSKRFLRFKLMPLRSNKKSSNSKRSSSLTKWKSQDLLIMNNPEKEFTSLMISKKISILISNLSPFKNASNLSPEKK